MMKKKICALLALTLAAAMTGCGANKNTSNNESNNNELQLEQNVETDDNDSKETSVEETEATTEVTEEEEPPFVPHIVESGSLVNGAWYFHCSDENNVNRKYIYDLKRNTIYEIPNSLEYNSYYDGTILSSDGLYDAETLEQLCIIGENRNIAGYDFLEGNLVISYYESDFDEYKSFLGIMGKDGKWVSEPSCERAYMSDGLGIMSDYTSSWTSICSDLLYFPYDWADYRLYDIMNDRLFGTNLPENVSNLSHCKGSQYAYFLDAHNYRYIKYDLTNDKIESSIDDADVFMSIKYHYALIPHQSDYKWTGLFTVINTETNEQTDYSLKGYNSAAPIGANNDAMLFCYYDENGCTAVSAIDSEGNLIMEPILGDWRSIEVSDDNFIFDVDMQNYIFNTKTKQITFSANTNSYEPNYCEILYFSPSSGLFVCTVRDSETEKKEIYVADVNDPENFGSPFTKAERIVTRDAE